jgi:hypothetical protein
MSLSSALLTQSTLSYPTSLTSIPCGLFFFRFLNQNLIRIFIIPTCATCPARLVLCNMIAWILFGGDWRSWNSSLCSSLQPLVTSSFQVQITALTTCSQTALTSCSQTLSLYVLPSTWKTNFHIHTKQVAKLYSSVYCNLNGVRHYRALRILPCDSSVVSSDRVFPLPSSGIFCFP